MYLDAVFHAEADRFEKETELHASSVHQVMMLTESAKRRRHALGSIALHNLVNVL